MRFGDEDIDALAARANATEYGLSSSIWTRDMSNGLRLAKRLRLDATRMTLSIVFILGYHCGPMERFASTLHYHKDK